MRHWCVTWLNLKTILITSVFSEEKVPWVAATVTFIAMAVAVALVAVVVAYRRRISHFLFPKNAIPQHFKEVSMFTWIIIFLLLELKNHPNLMVAFLLPVPACSSRFKHLRGHAELPPTCREIRHDSHHRRRQDCQRRDASRGRSACLQPSAWCHSGRGRRKKEKLKRRDSVKRRRWSAGWDC